jgi:ribosomal protein L21E
MSKSTRKKGKISLTQMFAKFTVGDKVLLYAEPAVQKGIFHRRFYGKTGIVKGSQGKCYKVEVNDNKKPKIFVVHPVHLRRV